MPSIKGCQTRIHSAAPFACLQGGNDVMAQNPEIDATAPRKPTQAFSFPGPYPSFRSLCAHAAPIAALLVCIFVAGCAPGLAGGLNIDDPAPDDPVARFMVLAFESEDGRPLPLTRFEAPVRVYGQGRYYGLSDTVVDLAAATGHDIRQVWGHEDANIIVTVAPWPTIRRMLDTLPDAGRFADPRWRFECAAFWYTAGGPEIVRSLIFIDSDFGEVQVRRCLVQEVAQSLGLHNDIDDFDGTVFSSYSTRDSLSDADRLMLAILYDDRLRPGMTANQARPIVTEIVRGLQGS